MCSTISAYIMFPLYIAEVSNEVSYQRNFREKGQIPGGLYCPGQRSDVGKSIL